LSGATLIVGDNGTGNLNINGGASLLVGDVSGDSVLGSSSGGVGTASVSGAGSTWTTSHQLFVGLDGVGSLAVQNGGTVSDSFGYIGYGSIVDNNASGSVTVTGPGSSWSSSSDLSVGSLANGSLMVQNGGHVDCKQGIIAPFGPYHGDVTVSD